MIRLLVLLLFVIKFNSEPQLIIAGIVMISSLVAVVEIVPLLKPNTHPNFDERKSTKQITKN